MAARRVDGKIDLSIKAYERSLELDPQKDTLQLRQYSGR